ncbi:60S ribosomal protein L29 [Sciurus carolinensis]|uniref:60S ribosomal protein L29 n=1 Tax=Sciurus carolinensis TaxID=30640 RepID=A0AA41MHT9_SCICA|nr:60S ribosomal protein L29 [Sciurus carolinensis]
MQANGAKAMSAHTEAIRALVKPKEVKPKMPKGASLAPFDCLAFLAQPKLKKLAQGLWALLAKAQAQAQTKTQAVAPAPAPNVARPPRVPRFP